MHLYYLTHKNNPIDTIRITYMKEAAYVSMNTCR